MRLHLAYLAGFFDADGSIVVSLQKQALARWTPALHVTLSFYNQDYGVLENIKATLGFGRLRAMRCGFSGVYRIEFTRRETLIVLEHLLPYLQVKREQAQLGILALTAPKYYGRGHQVPVDQQEYRQSLVARSKELNQRNGKAFRSKWVNSVDPSGLPSQGTETMPSQAAAGTGGVDVSLKVLRKV